jgi:hypothetical protein
MALGAAATGLVNEGWRIRQFFSEIKKFQLQNNNTCGL